MIQHFKVISIFFLSKKSNFDNLSFNEHNQIKLIVNFFLTSTKPIFKRQKKIVRKKKEIKHADKLFFLKKKTFLYFMYFIFKFLNFYEIEKS